MKYHYVPKCPKCGSTKTGYYIYLNESYDHYRIISQYMRKGELVRVKSILSRSDHLDLFCQDCEAEWRGEPITKKISFEEIEKECELRGITNEDILNNRYKRANAKDNFKKEKKVKRKERVKNLIKGIFR